MKTTRTVLAACVMLAAFSWTAKEALAHPDFIHSVEAQYLGSMHDKVLVYYNAPSGGTTIGWNFCKAKSSLPSGWDTQDDRSLRTQGDGAMCQEAPKYGSLGTDVERHVPSGGNTFISGEYLPPGRYIFSINMWAGTIVHHANGNHTTLVVQDLSRNGRACFFWRRTPHGMRCKAYKFDCKKWGYAWCTAHNFPEN